MASELSVGHALLIALALYVIIMVVTNPEWSPFGGDKSQFTSVTRTEPGDPYGAINAEIEAKQGTRNDAAGPLYLHPVLTGGAGASLADIDRAEQQAWYPSEANVDSSHVDSGAISSGGGDYNSYITGMVADPRTMENHRKWAAEIAPYSGVAKRPLDDLDLGSGLNFVGLRRPEAVAQHNPFQITEIGAEDLISNKRFDFSGKVRGY